MWLPSGSLDQPLLVLVSFWVPVLKRGHGAQVASCDTDLKWTVSPTDPVSLFTRGAGEGRAERAAAPNIYSPRQDVLKRFCKRKHGC